MSPAQAAWYESGVVHGIEIGREQLSAEIAATQAAAVERCLQGMAARARGVYIPSVAE